MTVDCVWEDKHDQPRLIDPEMMSTVLGVIVNIHVELYGNQVSDGDTQESNSGVDFITN